jgi:PAS domain S-box-containing protein
MSGESILVVEDEGFIALQIKELLEKGGYRVSGTTAYGEDAIAASSKSPPDLVCMDIELMGKMDGIEAARKIRENADIPIIFLTAHADSQRVARAKEAVPYSYIVKPFNDRELLVSVEMALYRHRIDHQLREVLNRNRAIVDNAAEGIIVFSATTKRILEANPAIIRLLGYSLVELTSMSIDNLLTSQPGAPVQMPECQGTSGSTPVEMQLRCRDGMLKDAEVTCSMISPGRDRTLCCLIAHDVTDRKRAEMAVHKANKKLTLLSSIIRHDIINQLTVLHGFLELSRQASAGTKNLEYIARELETAKTIRSLINFTKDYEGLGMEKPGWLKPERIIRHLAETADLKGITVESGLGELELYTDPLLERVFGNLLDNAVRHGEHVTMITITALPAGTGLMLRWEDNGVGVPDPDKERIFERGFGKNTGLGLFLVREILSLTGITIRENGSYGTGACFEMWVPPGSYRQMPAGTF